MARMDIRSSNTVLVYLLLLVGAATGAAQGTDKDELKPEAIASAPEEALNYIGGETSMPPMADSLVAPQQAWHRALWDKGIALRVIAQAQYTQNTLQAPVRADDQVYVGERPFQLGMVQPILTADLRQLHLKHAQLYMGSAFDWVSWKPAGPKTFQLWDLYFYKAFDRDRVQIKAGYVSTQLDFIGLFVGGSTATGGQGVYAVLPYEVGMSYFPMSTPGTTVRVKGAVGSYVKFGVQRSIDPNGGPAEVARNHTGFRFIPHGDKALFIQEAGYLRDAAKDAHQAWLRTGYLYNTTDYKNIVTGKPDSGNHCAYALMDYQVHQTNLERPNQGIYAGASYMAVPESLNGYARYVEIRAYDEAPLRSRPADLISVVASHTQYSPLLVNHLRMQGKSAWRGSTTLTTAYAMHASSGSYLTFVAGYIYGPAITPRVARALNLTANWTVFF